jgi:SPX domain protein involved in polyphosphate accumulation
MGKSKKIPLVSGLIGSKARSIHGQLEASYINYNTVKIELKRKLYTGLSDVKFSIADTDLADIIQMLNEAHQKIEAYWLTKISPERRELKAKKPK